MDFLFFTTFLLAGAFLGALVASAFLEALVVVWVIGGLSIVNFKVKFWPGRVL